MFAPTERRGPHKSMHCKFCKPPGTIYFSDVATPAQLETKTKLRLSHEVADLKVYDVYDEPGTIEEENEACICQLEGSGACPKCAPDKTRKPEKKKVCNCPVGAKPHPNMAILDVSNQKKKKEKVDDNEFWWEKYEREHDAMVKETWAAYMAQRKLDRKLSRCRELEKLRVSGLLRPPWFQKLSCQQTIYLEYLSTAIRLDLDENITDRTCFVLGGIGFYPRPTKKILQKCLRYCHYNAVRFLNQLSLLLQEDDPYGERIPVAPIIEDTVYSWNDRILMASICHLEFPKLLREIMDRLPPLPQQPLPPHIRKPKIKKNPNAQYSNPYEEPVWPEQIDWFEKRKLNRMKEYREHLNLKRVKIPTLALVRRPSLIDARPPFLSQIEANQSFNRRRKSPKRRASFFRKKKKATFDSKVDMTAIAGIEASEVSTTPKADPDEMCVFLRGHEPVTESIPEGEEYEVETEVEEEEEERKIEPILEPRVKCGEGMSTKSGSSVPLKMPDENLYLFDDDSDDEDDIPFVTPQKTQSGRTIEEPCPPPKSSPGPPVSHYDLAKREIGLINEELCVFDPNEVKSDDDEKLEIQSIAKVDIEHQLKQVVRKLKELNLAEEEEEEPEEVPKVPKKKKRRKKGKKVTQGKGKNNEKTTSSSKDKGKNNGIKISETVEVDHPDENQLIEAEKEESSESCICAQEKSRKRGKRDKSKRRKKSKKRKMKKENPCGEPKNTDERKTSDETVLNSDSDKKTEGESENAVGATEGEENIPSEEASLRKEEEEEEEGEKIFYGDVFPLLKVILKDLQEEGFVSAGFKEVHRHPDISQLMKYLRGEILTKERKEALILKTRWFWRLLDKRGKPKPVIPELKLSQKILDRTTWNDKKWLMNLIKKKKDEYYFYIAKHRADEAKDLYLSLHQEYFGTERYLNTYYAYMIAANHDSLVRGII